MKSETEKKIEVLITFPVSDNFISQINAVSPHIHLIHIPVRNENEISDDVWKKSEVLITERILPRPEKVPNLRWIQFNSAGIDFAVEEPIIQKSNLLVTTLSGAVAPQVAEYTLAMLLALSHKLPVLLGHQRNHEWPPDRNSRLIPLELRGSTIGILGYGSIGREIARLVQPLGVSVLASKNNVLVPEDRGYTIDNLGDPDGNLFTRLYPIQAVKSLVKECNFIIISLPRTRDTFHLIAEEELAAMKPGAFIIDVSRGGIIKTEALIAALKEKHIAGAVLDVFEQEPLPKDHPLWELPNIIITPHIAGLSIHYNERALVLLKENLDRYIKNSVLLNIFSAEQGY